MNAEVTQVFVLATLRASTQLVLMSASALMDLQKMDLIAPVSFELCSYLMRIVIYVQYSYVGTAC